MKKQIIACGRLEYNCYAEYELITLAESINISKILSKVYYSEYNNKIKIRIMNGSKTLFNEEGNLLLKRDQDGIYGYHINGENLDLALFNSVEKRVDIEIVADIADIAEIGDMKYAEDTYSRQVVK